MNHAGSQLLSVIALGLVCWLFYRRYVNARALLQSWADANGYKILHAKHRLFMPLGLILASSRAQVIYHVALYDTARKRNRSAWVRLGTYWMGAMDGDAVDVQWEDEA
ncbi:hypothetical protein I6J77_02660 [Rhodanobacter sp. FDAARGOS 1247]|uniref:hypothetical protein n=1 Tax=Rhodanobacter sp. FDAARGOS 1247 TaxID=2778082 RepID=UPI0019518693|nr:hypothetical protein [Rhodanobacter sp. FDAARGOS 1247]QRP64383.1 hypothetical protein I6J77_02660 [Rhodanobacter sp. FDAARGOS 1247]